MYLKEVVEYWRECVKAEGALDQCFGVEAQTFTLHEREKARFFTGTTDPFIFANAQEHYELKKGRLRDQVLKAALKDQDVHYGYPLLMFYDRTLKRNLVAPLFDIRVDVIQQGDNTLLTRGEPVPTVGVRAFTQLGLSSEEIVALNNEVTAIFENNKNSKLEVILYLLQNKTKLTFVEGIDPTALSNARKVQPYDGTVVYNKAIVSVGDTSAFNVHLLNDLDELIKHKDLEQSALNYISRTEQRATLKENSKPTTPILPFAFDEYHLQAIQHIIDNDHSVVTGPPGTGKSQFIANLIINLFLQKKRVLFVSHTGEAVRVVNERINGEFTNLMMQTGKKELRQDLGNRLSEMVSQYNEERAASAYTLPKHDLLEANWNTIRRKTLYLQKSGRLHRELEITSLKNAQLTLTPFNILQRIHSLILRSKLEWIFMQLQNRYSTHAILNEIEALRQHHTEMSNEHVKNSYLSLILDNDLYGELSAYIDAVQNNQSGVHSSAASDRYIDSALKAMNIWSCTLKSIGASFPLKAGLFDYVILTRRPRLIYPRQLLHYTVQSVP